jgi:hypothetical protein
MMTVLDVAPKKSKEKGGSPFSQPLRPNEVALVVVAKLKMPLVSTAKRFANLPRQVDIRSGNDNAVDVFHDIHDPMQRMRLLFLRFIVSGEM